MNAQDDDGQVVGARGVALKTSDGLEQGVEDGLGRPAAVFGGDIADAGVKEAFALGIVGVGQTVGKEDDRVAPNEVDLGDVVLADSGARHFPGF